jgi:hypothetical protein
MDLNLCRQIKDKWGFQVPLSPFSPLFVFDQLRCILTSTSQMTARLDMYARGLAEAISPTFKPQIIRDPTLPAPSPQ